MNSNEKKQEPPALSQKDQLIEFISVGLALLLLFASAIKVIFL